MSGLALNQVSAFGEGIWRYWRFGEPAPESNYVVQKLYAYTDGRSNDFLFRMLESKRKEAELTSEWRETGLVSESGEGKPNINELVVTLRRDGFVVIPARLREKTTRKLYEFALSCPLKTTIFGQLAPGEAPGSNTEIPIAKTGSSLGINLSAPSSSMYTVSRSQLLENEDIQDLMCDPYLMAIATRYLGVFPVVTKPDMWWDTDVLPNGLRPRPFHMDSGCLKWLKVGINLTDTTIESPHFVYVRGSHTPNRDTRPLTRRLASRMNLSHKEVADVCANKIVHVTAPAGSITLADTRGIHKGELAERGNRLILYFGLEGSAFNNIDQPMPLHHVGSKLAKAMSARPFSYQFFTRRAKENGCHDC
jgi:hypothetical protein